MSASVYDTLKITIKLVLKYTYTRLLWLNKHTCTNYICISVNDSNNIDFCETEKAFKGGKVTKIAKYAFQCGGNLVHNYF